MVATHDHIVVGAGIAGLTAALTLADFGFSVSVLEAAARLDPVGAGIQLSPNATSVLRRLGVLDALLPKASVIASIDLVAARDVKPLLSLDTSAFADKHTPFLAVSRGDLHMALLSAARARANITLAIGIAPDAQTKIVSNARCVIAADGVWSQTRRGNGGEPASYSGYVAQRKTIDRKQLSCPALSRASSVVAFVAPDAHLVAYPLEGGSRINLVSISKQPHLTDENLTKAPRFNGFAPELARALNLVSDWTAWPVYTLAPTEIWRVNERTMLIGDAAHALLPFAAQGAGMAIEDGFAIAHCMRTYPLDLDQAFIVYEHLRRARIKKIARRSKFNAFAYHASGPIAFARDLTFKLRGQQLMQDLKWLYDYRLPGL